MNRRHFLLSSSATLFSLPYILNASPDNKSMIKGIGMCDWNLGGPASYEIISKASAVGLDGIQVSIGTDPDNVPLRTPEIRKKYIELGKQHNIRFHSVAAGSILNKLPLASEPQSAVYVIDAIEAAQSIGADNILIAFFGNGDLRRKDLYGAMREHKTDGYSTYELDTKSVQRVVEVLKQIAPRAKDAGVYLGLENTLTAEQNMDIIDRIDSDIVKVYYDVGNSWRNGYNVPEEIKLLTNSMICEVHIKDSKAKAFKSEELGVDMQACAKALKQIGYDKWLVLETSGRKDQFEEDTRENIEFVKNTFY